MAEEFSLVGKRLPRADALEKVNGQIRHVTDMELPRMLYAKFLRSPHAHAKITRIDTSRAEELPGVKCVLTHKNVPKVHPRRKLEYLLDETVHCAGEEVAAVAAETKEIAEEALDLIKVEYEVLPAVFDTEEATKPGAPLAHSEYGSSLYHGTDYNPVPRFTPEGWLTLQYGDVGKGFKQADYIVEGKYKTPRQYNCSPLPRAVICEWSGSELTCWADTQIALWASQDLATCLGLPQSKVRLISSPVIGGYGAKEPQKIATLVALLAKKTGRPVKAAFSRQEDFIGTMSRPSYETYGKIGVKKNGTITAMQTRMMQNWGRDCAYDSLILATSGGVTSSMLYRWQNSKWEGCNVITNTIESGALNGFGDPEAGFCIERLIDEAAEAIGMDPVEFRLKNCMRAGDRAIEVPNVVFGPAEWGILGPDLDSFPECIRRAAQKAEWKEKWKGWKTPVAVHGSKRRGIGIAIGTHHGALWQASATIKMNQDGTANVLTMGTEIGQGFKTAMIQVVAEALGLPFESVNVTMADTAVVPASMGNIGSEGTSSMITVAKLAADKVRHKLFQMAAESLGEKPENLEAKDGSIYIKAASERATSASEQKSRLGELESAKDRGETGISIASLCLAGFQITASANMPVPIIDEKTGKVVYCFSVAVTIAEVEVDTDTGELNVLKLSLANDCGRAINPQILENQVDMSVTLANGWVRSEDVIIDKNTGAMLNPNLLDYKIMTILDMPKMNDMQETLVEFPTPWGPFGAKGCSETGMCSPGPAIANAIYNAIGVRLRGAHLSPESILEALGK